MTDITIWRVGADPVIGYAATELERHLARISGRKAHVRACSSYDPAEDGIWLGTWDAFGGVMADPRLEGPLDDAIFIKSVAPGRLLISGGNPRSVLFAVYAYLESLGCRWVRMGKDGEVLPENAPVKLDGYDVAERASYRYRGVCIEGGVSLEHAIDMVDYMAKKRFNTYFIQFQDAYIFWSRWYDRKLLQPALSEEKAEEYTARLVDEVKRRGLALQMVGHGWSCECLGVKGGGWMTTAEKLPPEKQELLAEVGGRRDWWKGIPIATELCLSNPKAFDALVDYIVAYAEVHPEVDLLHVWMSDGWNNRCECEDCRKKLPSDWYVDVLNAVDARLSALRISTRIVFLAYADLLWAPSEARFNNPERFVIMFAPLTRLWRNSLLESPVVNEEPAPFALNRNVFPKSTAVNVHYLREWQRLFGGDGFTFDYHLLWKHSIIEPTGLFIAEILHRDILQTDQLGLQGMVNCQVQRYFFPTGIAMEVSGRAMWNKNLTFDEIKKDYFAAAFGAHGGEVRDKLEKLSGLMESDIIFGLAQTPSEAYARRLADAERLREETARLVDRCLVEGGRAEDGRLNEGVRASFRYLRRGLEFIGILLGGFRGLAAGSPEVLSKAYGAAGEYIIAHEDELHEVCDYAMWKGWLDSYAREGGKVTPGVPNV